LTVSTRWLKGPCLILLLLLHNHRSQQTALWSLDSCRGRWCWTSMTWATGRWVQAVGHGWVGVAPVFAA